MRHMRLRCQGEVVFDKILEACAALKIELERPAQIGRTNLGRGHAEADVHVRNPTCASGKIVAKMWSKTHKPVGTRRILRAREQFHPELKIAAIPFVFSQNVVEHMAVTKADHSEVMSFHTGEFCEPDRYTRSDLEGLCAAAESFTDPMRPDTRRRFRVQLQVRA